MLAPSGFNETLTWHPFARKPMRYEIQDLLKKEVMLVGFKKKTISSEG